MQFVSATLEKTYPHSLQSKRFVLVCLSICFLRQLFIEKLALHAMQLNHLSPGCVCTCSFKWPFVKNHSFHLIQLNGFSPVSVHICVLKFMKIQHHFLVVYWVISSLCSKMFSLVLEPSNINESYIRHKIFQLYVCHVQCISPWILNYFGMDISGQMGSILMTINLN